MLCAMAVLASLSLAPTADLAAIRANALKNVWGTYDWAPYVQAAEARSQPSMRMDVQALVDDLVDLGVNTYVFLIWHHAVDWVELHRFLPEARKRGINVWVYICPPSEQPPVSPKMAYCEPYRTDFVRWGEEIARLSLREPNLTAWCIDDFPVDNNLKILTPAYMKKVVEAGRRVNPKLAFLPCVYDMTGGKAERIQPYKGLFDGLLMCHNKQSEETNDEEHRAYMKDNLAAARKVFGPKIPIVSFQFTTRWKGPLTSPEKTSFLMNLSRELCDGVLCYLHPALDAPNRGAMKAAFKAFGANRKGLGLMR